jgi:hypothetical protein
MKGKKLSFPFISFSESRLFNWLRAKIKKFGHLLTRVPGCAEFALTSLSRHAFICWPAMIGLGRPFARKCAFPIIRQC